MRDGGNSALYMRGTSVHRKRDRETDRQTDRQTCMSSRKRSTTNPTAAHHGGPVPDAVPAPVHVPVWGGGGNRTCWDNAGARRHERHL